MSTTNASQALAAFVRLLLHARAGGQAKVDALLALSQRTLYVPRKLDGSEGFATLINENGDWALPVFTSLDQLEAAADVFGWRQQNHKVAYDEVGARRAVHYALNEGAAYMVIDAVAAHALEALREELKPLVSSQNRSDASGPYAGVGRITSSILEATRPTDLLPVSLAPLATPRISRVGPDPSFAPPKLPSRVTRASFAPPRDDGVPAQRRPTVSFARVRGPAEVEVQLETNAWAADESLTLNESPMVSPLDSGSAQPGLPLPSLDDLPSLDFESDTPHSAAMLRDSTALRDTDRPPASPMAPAPDVLGARPSSAPPAASAAPATDRAAIQPLSKPADDELLAAFTELLRDFPEVEWATYSLAVRGGVAKPAVGLRVLDSFRTNVDDITARLEATARTHGVAPWVLLLDDPDLVRDARTLGEVFYPWRRKTRS